MKKAERGGLITNIRLEVTSINLSMTFLKKIIWEILEWYLPNKKTQRCIWQAWKPLIGLRKYSSSEILIKPAMHGLPSVVILLTIPSPIQMTAFQRLIIMEPADRK